MAHLKRFAPIVVWKERIAHVRAPGHVCRNHCRSCHAHHTGRCRGANEHAAAITAACTTSAPAQPASNPLNGLQFGLALEGFYQYNWNRPFDRINLLRAYDTRANTFGIQQAALVVRNRARCLQAGRRFGGRVDLQFGQATETVQGSAGERAAAERLPATSGRPTAPTCSIGTRPADRLRQVRVESRLRDELRQGQQPVLARLPVQLPAVLPLRCAPQPAGRATR